MIIILDFGSQTAHLIARRIQDLGVRDVMIPGDTPLDKIPQLRVLVKGIILSGGPSSVYGDDVPLPDKAIYRLGVPILGICYGLQATAYLLGGKVLAGKQGEYGPAQLQVIENTLLFTDLPKTQRVWLSHGDEVVHLPVGFSRIASTQAVLNTAIANEKKKIYGVQFHPEVEHTEYGFRILENFVRLICKVETKIVNKLSVENIVAKIQQQIGDASVIAAVSGGLDSTVAATLVARAIGKRLIPIHVTSGLMRPETTILVENFFTKRLRIKPIILPAEKKFLSRIRGIEDPEKKRKIIGKLYIDLLEQVRKKHRKVKFLVQGTIYSDVIESKGSQHAAKIKSHHNVGGLPKSMGLRLIEPIRELYTDEVRLLAQQLGIPDQIIFQQPHPGPGYAIRIIGKVTTQRLRQVRQADAIVVEEMKRAEWYEKLLHSFAVHTGSKSTAVRGDNRLFGDVIALRCITSSDRMTGDWPKLPYDLLQKISSRIVNEVSGISRVVYDITTKPPATIEWE